MGDKTSYKPLLTSQNEAGADWLTDYLMSGRGEQAWAVPNTDAGSILDVFMRGAQEGRLPGLSPAILERLTNVASGNVKPFQNDALINDILAKAAESGTLEYQTRLAEASQAGNPFSSASRAAATRAAASMNLEGRIAAAKERAQQMAADLQLEAQSAQLLIGATEAAGRLGLTAAQLRTAALQFEAGLSWEEWKQRNPGAYQVATALWGRNVDFVGEKKASWVGPALMAIGGILAPFTGGASLALAGAGANMLNSGGPTGVAPSAGNRAPGGGFSLTNQPGSLFGTPPGGG